MEQGQAERELGRVKLRWMAGRAKKDRENRRQEGQSKTEQRTRHDSTEVESRTERDREAYDSADVENRSELGELGGRRRQNSVEIDMKG